jgi:hypothetical protein
MIPAVVDQGRKQRHFISDRAPPPHQRDLFKFEGHATAPIDNAPADAHRAFVTIATTMFL